MNPRMKRLVRNNAALIQVALAARKAGVVFLLSAATALASPPTFNTLARFNGTDGQYPYDQLVQGFNGNYYGTTAENGANGFGTVFEITPAGKLTTLYNFCSKSSCADGANPSAGLAQAISGNLYGTTYYGGANNAGTVFEITPAGKLTTLYSFCSHSSCTDGQNPEAGLMQAPNGNFYGTTYLGGSSGCAGGCGTVFEITPAGKLTTLYTFCSKSGCPDGSLPYAGLVQGTNGNFYGTTQNGGATNNGTVFEITPTGRLTTLHSFCISGCGDGANPYGGLVQAANGNFYGTTYYGGAYSQGTAFEMTPAGKLTRLYSFCAKSGCGDGANPNAGLVQGTNGDLYGTTYGGGANNDGTVFAITAAGKLTTLYSFCSQSGCADGEHLYAALMQATNGTFYGTTRNGGSNGDFGTVFSDSVGLGPFVETLFTLGQVGANVVILGNNLTGSTAVSFNGKAAIFTLVSATEIKTIVPNGATTGAVTVTTPGGKLTSSVKFRVTPQIKSFTPTSGPVGTQVTITGVSLTQTTKVTFGGTAATSFTVDSDSEVTATVPTGAKTGQIAITTLGGTAASSGIFTVTQ